MATNASAGRNATQRRGLPTCRGRNQSGPAHPDAGSSPERGQGPASGITGPGPASTAPVAADEPDRPARRHTVTTHTKAAVDDIASQLSRLSHQASRCAEALELAATRAADPQLRALLSHRASLQRCAAAELAYRAGPQATEAAARARPPRRARERAGDPSPSTDAWNLLQEASQEAARAVAGYAAMLRAELTDPTLRPLLVRYYQSSFELQRMLEQRAREVPRPPALVAGRRRTRVASP